MDQDEAPATDRAPKLAARPRVVHVTTSHRADDVRIFERECRSLVSNGGYDVFLAAHGSIPSGSGVMLIPLGARPSSRLRRFVAGPLKAWALSRALEMDLWHFHDPELLPVAISLARSGKQVIWDAHEDYLAQFTGDGAKSWVPHGLRGLVRGGFAMLLRIVDRRIAAVVAATPTIASRYLNRRTVVVGNEARLEDFAFCRPNFDAGRVLFTGSVSASHLFPEIIEAMTRLPGATLAVAGRDPDPATWANATSRLGGRILHLGWLDRAGLGEAISQSSIGLVTYADLPPYADAAPTKLFEFGAAGLPCVATPNRSNIGYVEDGAGSLLAEGFAAGGLQAAISAALSDRGRWESYSAKGREWASRQGSWASSETRLLTLYRDVLPSQESPTSREELR